MRNHSYYRPYRNLSRNKGFSLVEILISAAIGIFITAGSLSIYTSNKDSYRLQEAISGTLRNSRFIINRFERKINEAGYSSFYTTYTDSSGLEVALNSATNILWSLQFPVFGYDNVNSSTTYAGVTGVLEGTDVLVLKAMTDEHRLTSPSSSTSLTFDAESGFINGDILIVTDLDKASIFQIDSADDTTDLGSTTVTLGTGSTPQPGNSATLINTYNTSASIGKLETLVYAIMPKDDGTAALFEGRLTTSDSSSPVTTLTELIPNVENMQLIYGIDTDNNGSVDKYIAATSVTTGEWGQVHTIGLSLLLASQGKNVAYTNNSYHFDSENFTFTKDQSPSDAADKRLRDVFTTYVTLKNL